MSAPPEIPWVPADQNPWKVPILDVRPVTQGMIATTQNQTLAANAVSYGGEDGTSFADMELPTARVVPAKLRYRRDRLFAEGALFVPSSMEHKWALYHHDGEILCVRSWQRMVFVAAQVEQDGDEVRIDSLHGAFGGDQPEDPALSVRLLDCLLRTHVLGMIHPVPLPPGLEQDPRAAAMWCFSLFGNKVHCATPHEIPFDVPQAPLRSHSLLHIAVARGDAEGVDAQLKAGIPIDLPALDGLAPLHWAFANKGTDMLELLVARGSPVDVRSVDGATPLMLAAQSDDTAPIEWLLGHGADAKARDRRGFTALHRAAEMGHRRVVEVLLSRGADPAADAEGHTPLSLAEGRKHEEIVRLLRRT